MLASSARPPIPRNVCTVRSDCGSNTIGWKYPSSAAGSGLSLCPLSDDGQNLYILSRHDSSALLAGVGDFTQLWLLLAPRELWDSNRAETGATLKRYAEAQGDPDEVIAVEARCTRLRDAHRCWDSALESLRRTGAGESPRCYAFTAGRPLVRTRRARRQAPGDSPTMRLNAREKAASFS